MDAQQLANLWIEAGGDPSVAPVMAALALQQSGGNPGAVNQADPNGGSWGLWQINGGNQSLLDPLANAKEAVAMYRSSGFSPWATVNEYNGSVWNTSGPVTGTTTNPVIAAWNAGQDVFSIPASGGGAATTGYGSVKGYTAGAFNAAGLAVGAGVQTPPGVATTASTGQAQPVMSVQQEQADLDAIAKAGGIKAIDLSVIPPNLLATVRPEVEKYLSDPALQKAIEERIASDYGYQAWILQDPQVAAALLVGAIGNWDGNTFLGVLEQTKWWQQHNENQRAWLEISGTDPATARELLLQAQDKILATSKALGVQLTAGQLAQMAYTVASNSATQTGVITNRLGFTSEQIDAMVAGAYRYNNKTPQGGDAAQLFDAFQKLSAEYLVPMGQNAIGQHVQNAIHNYSGQGDFLGGSTAAFENYMKQQAVSVFPTMAQAIKEGMTPYQWTEPYRQMAGSVLEKNPNSIDLTSPEYRWMIDQVDPKTGQRTVATIADAQTKLMADPRYGYQYTQTARDQAYTIVDKLAQTFGRIGGAF